MSSTSENETEILLGNRHLLAIFFVLAILLGIAFTGGYMVGRNSPDKKPPVLSAAPANDPVASTATSSLQTHDLTPASDSGDQTATDQTRTVQPPPPAEPAPQAVKEQAPLGSPREAPTAEEQAAPEKAAAQKPPPAAHLKPSAATFTGPQSGQTFLQVAAVGHTEANALADVLSKKGFRAHAVAKPGASDVYRVLIGPMRDMSELSATRDSLRNAGFTKIFVQRY